MTRGGPAEADERPAPAAALLPTVPEPEAVGEIAELYADIRRTLGVSVVNLVWRNLATVPGGLRWAWSSLRPLYSHGAIYAMAESLRKDTRLPQVPPMPRSVLRGAGVDAAAEHAIGALLRNYDRANPLNTIAFSALLARLDGDHGEPDAPPPPLPPLPHASPAEDLPGIVPLDDMTQDTVRLVHTVNRLGGRGCESILVSLPRNLAHWPGFLALYWSIVAPFQETGELGRLVDDVRDRGLREGSRLVGLLGDAPIGADVSLPGVRASLETLVPGAMTRMIPVVGLLARAMPQAGSSRRDSEGSPRG